MTGPIVGIIVVALVILAVAYRLIVGSDDADRAVASDLLFFAVIGMFAMIGTLVHSTVIFDVVLVATVVGFLASVSLARAITKGRR